MTESLTPKSIRASRVTLSQLMHPEHANLLGNVHGGWIMKLADEAGALSCMRHAHRKVVTVAIDSMTFRQPIKLGDLVILNSEVTYTGRTSMEATVQVVAENPITGERTHTNTLTWFMSRWTMKAVRRLSHLSKPKRKRTSARWNWPRSDRHDD